MRLKQGDKVALVALSNGLGPAMKEKIEEVTKYLEEMGLEVICSPYLYAYEGVAGAPGKLRAENLMAFYEEDGIRAILDVSGGDIANEVLPGLDYELIKKKEKFFMGYSDLTTVINALYAQTGKSSYLYQIRNIAGDCGAWQRAAVRQTLLEGEQDLTTFDYRFLQGDHLEGIVIGGNIRCFLKLAGTPYMPDFKDKILFLESRSGGITQMTTFLNQYQQIGAFKEIKGLILGCFTEMEDKQLSPTIEELVVQTIERADLPIVKTSRIGHGADSKAIQIGEQIVL